MSVFLKSYTRALKSYDSDLFAAHNVDGVVCVFRYVKRYELVVDEEGFKMFNLIQGKQFIFALTTNWTLSGRSVDWGIDHVVGRVRKIDALANERLLDEMDEANEQVDKSKKRAIKNEMEAFWSHERRRFAKATDGILTHSLSKDDKRKRLKDRSIKNGNN